jgi:hypothetical protein
MFLGILSEYPSLIKFLGIFNEYPSLLKDSMSSCAPLQDQHNKILHW